LHHPSPAVSVPRYPRSTRLQPSCNVSSPGNEAYASEIGRLANPHNDVALLEQALEGLGFDVVTVRDASLGGLNRAVNVYVRRLQAAGSGAVGFFYYSSHGASDGRTNYLIPIDVKTTEAGELRDESLQLSEITRKLK
jgi:uncharacterized caspase-like protein